MKLVCWDEASFCFLWLCCSYFIVLLVQISMLQIEYLQFQWADTLKGSAQSTTVAVKFKYLLVDVLSYFQLCWRNVKLLLMKTSIAGL